MVCRDGVCLHPMFSNFVASKAASRHKPFVPKVHLVRADDRQSMPKHMHGAGIVRPAQEIQGRSDPARLQV